ncbi:MAG: hypothetical protein WBF42_08410 [Terracidiphilus sp.]
MYKAICYPLVGILALTLAAAPSANAQRRGGGGEVSRGSARNSVNHAPSNNMNRNANVNHNANFNNNTNVNRNTNVNVNRNVDVNVHNDYHGGYYGGGYYGGGCCYHPVATAAAVTATAMVTAAVIGSVVNTVPPSCVVTMVNGITYQQCGSTWYQPQFVGGNTSYVVVNAPR